MVILPWLKRGGVAEPEESLDPSVGRPSRAGFIRQSLPFWMGAVTFCLAPLFQSSGLALTGASENALLIALEPVSAVLMALLVLSERPMGREYVSLGIAFIGVFVLSGGLSGGVSNGGGSWIGNLLIVASLLGEGFFSAGGRILALEHSGVSAVDAFTRSLSWGALLLSVIVLPLHGVPVLSSFDLSRALALLWIGPFGTAFSYFIWLRLLESTPVSALSVSLFVQPLAGLAFSVILLGESPGISQLVGGVLILAAMSVQVFGRRVLKIAHPK